MAAPISFLTVLTALASIASVAVGETAPMKVKLGEILRNEYRFDPEKTPAHPPEKDARPEAPMLLPTYTVSDRRLWLAVDRALRQQEKAIKDKAYSVVRGGTIVERQIGRTKVELGTWTLGPNLGLVRISW